MRVSELFDIEPSHTDVNEVSRRRVDYGDGYAPVGYATLGLAGRVSGASLGDCETFGIHGIRGKDLLVRYLGGYRHGTEHGPGRLVQPYFWVTASLFGDGEIEILSKARQPLPERYWHPNWREINTLPPQEAS
jgi:hypothetical protein